MEFLILAIVGFTAWFFLSGQFNNNYKKPESMSREALINAYIELKSEVLITTPYTQKYHDLSRRLDSIISGLFTSHEYLIRDVEVKYQTWDITNLLIRKTHNDVSGIKSYTWGISYELDLNKYESDLLLYISLFLHQGGHIQRVGYIADNQEKMIEILDFLINEREYYPAFFFKGFVYKYGIKPSSMPKLDEAKTLLESAMKRGMGAARLELQDLHRLDVIQNITPIQMVS